MINELFKVQNEPILLDVMEMGCELGLLHLPPSLTPFVAMHWKVADSYLWLAPPTASDEAALLYLIVRGEAVVPVEVTTINT